MSDDYNEGESLSKRFERIHCQINRHKTAETQLLVITTHRLSNNYKLVIFILLARPTWHRKQSPTIQRARPIWRCWMVLLFELCNAQVLHGCHNPRQSWSSAAYFQLQLTSPIPVSPVRDLTPATSVSIACLMAGLTACSPAFCS